MLGYAARRVEAARRAARADRCATRRSSPGHPLHRLLGVLAGEPVHRLELSPLSREAVGALADGTGRDADAVHALTRGNPFFVAEALAAPPDEVPGERQGRGAARVRQRQRRTAARRWSGCRSCRRRSRRAGAGAARAGAGDARRGRAWRG